MCWKTLDSFNLTLQSDWLNQRNTTAIKGAIIDGSKSVMNW